MKYKVVVLDMDGTLLNNHREIPEENQQIIKILKEKGIKFVIATGRPDIMTEEYVKLLGIKAPVLGSNGASVRDMSTKEIYSLKSIKKGKLIEIVDFFKEKKLYPRFYSLDEVYSFNKDEFQEKNPFINSVRKLAEKMEYKIVEYLDELLKENKEIIKITYPSYDVELLISLQKELKNIEGIEVVRGTKFTLDIMTENVSKGNTLVDYLETIGVLKEEVVAIGDGENDISMLKLVGLSVAMENGDEELKKIADMISLSNENSGVAYALKKIFNMN